MTGVEYLKGNLYNKLNMKDGLKDHYFYMARQYDEINKRNQETDSILESLIEKYKQRSELGIKKYNTTLDRTDLSLIDWINHAQEEAMDLSLYLEKIKTMLNG